jgi:hypothetical protein
MSGVIFGKGARQLTEGFASWAFQELHEMPLPNYLVVARHTDTGSEVLCSAFHLPGGLTGLNDTPIDE